MQVIGQCANLESSAHQGGQGGDGVIDARQQNSLIEHVNAYLSQPANRGGHVVVKLVGVVGVQHKHRWPRQRLQPVKQVVGNAVGQHNGQARMNAQKPDVTDVAQHFSQLGEDRK